MNRQLTQPITIRRKGRVRVVTKVQTCWFTGAELVVQNRGVGGADRGKPELPNCWTLEHVVPAVSHLIALIPEDQQRKNTVPAAALVNHAIGSLPIAIKMVVRDRLRMALHGTTDLKDAEPIQWTNAMRSMALKVIREEDQRYRLLGKKIWHDPVVVPAQGIRLWSLENPYHPITPELLEERDRLLLELRDATVRIFAERFGRNDAEVVAAVERDLAHHVVENGRDTRRKADFA